jgi:hypothetical protein
MVNSEWGKKRTCQVCSARFYDMLSNPITCPACSALFNPDFVASKVRKTKQSPSRLSVDTSSEDTDGDTTTDGAFDDLREIDDNDSGELISIDDPS